MIDLLKKDNPFGLKHYDMGGTEEKIVIMLEEEAHSFSGQYEIARKCAFAIIEALEVGNTATVVDASDINKDFKRIEIIINNTDSPIDKTNARFIQLNGVGLFNLLINISLDTRIKRYSEKFADIKDVISHELMHGEIFQKRYDNIVDINGDIKELDDVPSEYGYIVKVMQKFSEIRTDSYYYARALYSIYYQETQALISQAWPQFEIEMKQIGMGYADACIYSNFIGLFKKTDVYQTFMNNLLIADKISEKGVDVARFIEIDFKDVGCNTITTDKIIKSAKDITEISENGIRKAEKNIYIYLTKEKD